MKETFLQILKQDCFLFSFVLFINYIQRKRPSENVWEPFWIIRSFLKNIIMKAHTQVIYFNESGKCNSRAEPFILK